MKTLAPRMPTAPIFAWDMCPPSDVATAVILSPGFVVASRTAMLATVPDIGLTSTNSALKTSWASCSQMVSISST